MIDDELKRDTLQLSLRDPRRWCSWSRFSRKRDAWTRCRPPDIPCRLVAWSRNPSSWDMIDWPCFRRASRASKARRRRFPGNILEFTNSLPISGWVNRGSPEFITSVGFPADLSSIRVRLWRIRPPTGLTWMDNQHCFQIFFNQGMLQRNCGLSRFYRRTKERDFEAIVLVFVRMRVRSLRNNFGKILISNYWYVIRKTRVSSFRYRSSYKHH